MGKQAIRARITALGILLAFTLTVYALWRANQDWETASSVEHHKVSNPWK